MRTKIHSRKLNLTFNFWMKDAGGYVRLESAGKSGTLATQICDGGGFRGNTVTATPETFEKVCRRWYRQHVRTEFECQ